MLAAFRSLGQQLRDWAYALPAPPITRSLAGLGLRVARNFSHNDGTHMAAGMAYYTLFSLFPLALGAIAVAGYFAGSERAQVELFEFLDEQLPGLANSELIRENIQDLVSARGTLSVVSVIALFVAGRAVFGALHRIMNRAWRVPEPRHFLVQQLRQMGMAVGVGFVLLGSVFLSTFGQLVGEGPGLLGIKLDFILWAWAALFALLPLFLSTSLFLLIYRFIPNAPVRWREVLPAAVLAGLVFEASKIGFVLYLDNFASFDRVYGSISTLVVLLIWAYVASIILVVGAEVASEYGRTRRQGSLRFHGSLRPVRGGLRPSP